MKKRILSVLLAAALLLSGSPVNSFAAESAEYALTAAVYPDTGFVAVGDTVMVEFSVTSGTSAVTTYNSYDLKLTFDDAMLTLESSEAPDPEATVEVDGGSIRVKGYGGDKSFSTVLLTLVFRVKQAGTTQVTLQEAKIDRSGNAGSQNAPSARVPKEPISIEAGETYDVVLLGDGLRADSLVASPNADYVFYVDDYDLYDYTVTVSVEGEDISDQLEFDAGSGTCTIPKECITGDLRISATRTGKTFSVTMEGEDVSGANTATYLKDYTFTLNPQSGYQYSVSVTIGGKQYHDFTVSGNRYTIPGEDITADVVIQVQKTGTAEPEPPATEPTEPDAPTEPSTEPTEPPTEPEEPTEPSTEPEEPTEPSTEPEDPTAPSTEPEEPTAPTTEPEETEPTKPVKKYKVTFKGSGAGDASGAKSAEEGKAYTFKVNMKKGYSYGISVTVGGKKIDYKYDSNKKTYTIPKEKVTGDITVTVTKTKNVEVVEYLTMDGASMYLVQYFGTVGKDQVPQYEGNSMYRSDLYGAYVWLTVSSESLAEVEAQTEEKIKLKKDSIAGTVNYSGNVNLSLYKDADDVQLVWQLYNGRYTLQNMEMLKYLNADVNGDKKLNVQDAAAVLYLVRKEGR